MRRNATKVAAAALSLAVTMTSINLPTTAAAATKKVKLNKTTRTLRVGQSMNLKLRKVSNNKNVKATFTSNKPKIASVSTKTGKQTKVTAKKVGKCKITAKYAGKKYKCQIIVKKATVTTTTTPSTEPSAVPSTTPSTEPSAAPTATPSTEPSAAPTATPAAGIISTASAIGPNQIRVKFNAALPTNAIVKLINSSGAEVAADESWDEGRTTLTLTAKSNAASFPIDTYSVTVTLDGKETDKKGDIKIERQKVSEIKITSKKALTSSDRKQLYVYYDVLDQYGASMRKMANITWSSSTGKVVYDDKEKGRLTLEKVDVKGDDQFKYTDRVLVIGVDTTTGVNGRSDESLVVDMERALSSVEFVGFISKYDTKIRKTLPRDFAKDRYYLLYKAFDQEGHEMDVANYAATGATNGSSSATFTTTDFELIGTDLTGVDPMRAEDKEYCAIKINPGMSVDKGGNIKIISIAHATGTKNEGDFSVDSSRRLQSLVLHAPTSQVADGDEITLNYTATDDKGDATTNYETIVRSSNKLRLVASEGKLKIEEDANGKAIIKWIDSKQSGNFNDSSAYDNAQRNISLTTMVTNGDAPSIVRFNVSDARRPVAVSNVKVTDDNDKNIIAEEYKHDINLFDNTDVTYIDQYNCVITESKIVKNFFTTTNELGKGFDNNQYGLYVDYKSVVNDKDTDNDVIKINLTDETSADKSKIWKAIYEENDTYVHDKGEAIFISNNAGTTKLEIKTTESEESEKDKENVKNIKYYVVKIKQNAVNNTGSNAWFDGTDIVDNDSNNPINNTSSKLDTELLSVAKDIKYTVVPVNRLSDLKIKDIGRLRVETDYSSDQNGMKLQKTDADTDADIEDVANKGKRKMSVYGYFEKEKVTIPTQYYKLNEGKNGEVETDFTDTFKLKNIKNNNSEVEIEGINTNATGAAIIKYRDLYNFDEARNLRKVAKKNISINVYNTTNEELQNEPGKKDNKYFLERVTLSVEVSDAASSPNNIYFLDTSDKVLDKLTLRATFANLKINDNVRVKIVDQYGDDITSEKLKDSDVLLSDIVAYHVGNINEAVVGDAETLTTIDNNTVYAHLPNSFNVTKNNTKNAEIEGAEIKDTFNLTATIDGTSVTCTVPVTMGSDKNAFIDSDGTDEGKTAEDVKSGLRYILGYNR